MQYHDYCTLLLYMCDRGCMQLETIVLKVKKNISDEKVVGCRNWRQRWCKKEGNKVLRKG